MIIFRTNGGKDSGLGHMMRCMSLAQVLSARCPEEKIIFRANGEMEQFVLENGFEFQLSEQYDEQDEEAIKKQNPEFVVFDSYLANTNYLRKIKQNTLLVQFDDNNDIYIPVVADIVINGNIHAKHLDYNLTDANTKLLLGPEYLIMREEYLGAIEETAGNGILITTGGSDFNNLMPLFVKALKNTDYKKKIIIGPSYTEKELTEIEKLTAENKTFELIYKPKSLKEYIQQSEIVITAAGSTVYEVLRLKRIPIIYTLAENQNQIAASLVNNNVISLGDYKDILFEESFIEEHIKKAFENRDKIKNLYLEMDGKGVFRIVEEIVQR
jgi:UDP-2,4-diacetamido-2,4,6-trideoxy-beta-L-altropyranose hydrolase